MIETLLQAILEQVDQPKKDLEHNVRALLNEAVSKMDLVSREELDRQKTALTQANLRLNDLLKQVEQLELKIQHKK
jgi:BMFP domain-containing protein YqiC